MKDATLRIESVKTFIQNCNVLGPNERMRAFELARNFIQNRYPPGNAGQVAYETFASGMSLGFHMRSDPNDLRQMKRAAYLLTKAIKDSPGAAIPDVNLQQLPDGQARAKFEDVMRKAACVRDAGLGSNQSAQNVMAAMNNQPLAFLSTNKLIINGSASAGNGPGAQNVLQFSFYYEITTDRYKIEPIHPTPGSHQFHADSIVAQFWTTACDWAGHPPAGDFRQIQAIECGSAFMVTTQFTGCSFCMKRHNGHVYCAHVAPTRAPADAAAPVLTGTQIGQRIDDHAGVHGDFINAAGGGVLPSIYAPAFTARVAHPGYPNGLGGGLGYMTIIGFQRGADYEIYSQITQNHAISSAQRIF